MAGNQDQKNELPAYCFCRKCEDYKMIAFSGYITRTTAIILVGGALAFTLAAPVRADIACHMLDDAARLACYDAATGYKAPDTQTRPAGDNWEFRLDRDEMTDKDTSFVVLAEDQPNGSDAVGAVILRCNGKGGYDTYIVSAGYWGGGDRISVTYRFDDAAPVSEKWAPSTDGRAAFLPDGYKDFRTALLSGDYTKLTLRVEDFRGSTSTAIFNNIQPTDELKFVVGGCSGG